jgi:hypothetical protein
MHSRAKVRRGSYRIAEPLERRMLLAFYTVTGTADNTDSAVHGGAGTQLSPFQMSSLRGATIAANSFPGSTITLPAGTYQLTIAGDANDRGFVSFDPTKGDLNLNDSGVTIQGAGAASTTIQQNTGADRIITVNGNSLVGFVFTLSGVKMTGGRDTTTFEGGAGLFSGGKDGTTTVSNCVFVNNAITGSAGNGGGAICNTGGSLNVTNCTFGGTGASDPNVASTSGGAISYNPSDFVNPMGTGVLTVTGCTFINNSATGNNGGAIDISNTNLSAGSANISNSLFMGNKVLSGSGGGISVETATNGVTVSRCTFDGNQSLRGGAVSAGNTTTVQYCRIVNNTASSGQGTGIYRVATTVTANDNWWGRNSGPTAAETFNGVTVTSWLQLRNTPTATTINIGQATTLTADLLGRNTGGPIAASNLVGLPSFPSTPANVFGNAIKGTLSSISTQFVNGIATANFTGAAPGGIGKADATADTQVVTASVSIIPAAPNTPDLQAGSDSGSSSTDNVTNVASPVFDITGADATATVQLLRDGSQIGSRSGSGAITETSAAAGAPVYTARQVIEGVSSAASAGLSVTIDRTAPAAPAAPDLQAGSDSGSSNSDNLTNGTTLSFDLSSVETGASVALLRDGTSRATRTGAGSITDPGPISEGGRSYTAVQTDVAGIVGPASGALTVRVDRPAPAAPTVGPDLQAASDSGSSSTDNVTKINNPTFDLGGTIEAGASMQLLRGASVVATRTGTGSAQDAGPVADGTYTYTAKQIDAAGNIGSASAGVSVTIDTVANAPTAPDLQAGSDSGTSNSDNTTNVSTATFDLTGTETGASVQLLRDGSSVATRTGNGAITDPGPISDGLRNYTVVQTDVAGNVSSASTALGVNFDRAAPQVVGSAVFVFDVNSPMSVQYTFNENVQPSLGVSDIVVTNQTTATTIADGSKAIAYNGGTNVASLTFPGFSDGAVPNGNYQNSVTAGNITDVAGNPLAANTFNFFFVAADANRDKSCDLTDFTVLASNFNTSGKTYTGGNYNFDAAGNVDLTDFTILAANFNKSIPASPASASAAPATAGLAAAVPTSTKTTFSSTKIDASDASLTQDVLPV